MKHTKSALLQVHTHAIHPGHVHPSRAQRLIYISSRCSPHTAELSLIFQSVSYTAPPHSITYSFHPSHPPTRHLASRIDSQTLLMTPILPLAIHFTPRTVTTAGVIFVIVERRNRLKAWGQRGRRRGRRGAGGARGGPF